MKKLIAIIIAIAMMLTTFPLPKGERIKVRGHSALRPMAASISRLKTDVSAELNLTGLIIRVNRAWQSVVDAEKGFVDKKTYEQRVRVLDKALSGLVVYIVSHPSGYELDADFQVLNDGVILDTMKQLPDNKRIFAEIYSRLQRIKNMLSLVHSGIELGFLRTEKPASEIKDELDNIECILKGLRTYIYQRCAIIDASHYYREELIADADFSYSGKTTPQAKKEKQWALEELAAADDMRLRISSLLTEGSKHGSPLKLKYPFLIDKDSDDASLFLNLARGHLMKNYTLPTYLKLKRQLQTGDFNLGFFSFLSEGSIIYNHIEFVNILGTSGLCKPPAEIHYLSFLGFLRCVNELKYVLLETKSPRLREFAGVFAQVKNIEEMIKLLEELSYMRDRAKEDEASFLRRFEIGMILSEYFFVEKMELLLAMSALDELNNYVCAAADKPRRAKVLLVDRDVSMAIQEAVTVPITNPLLEAIQASA